MLRNLFMQLWNDESGAVVATEYLMLGSIVALGSAAGMAEIRDSMIDEYKDLGQSIRETRQSYSVPGQRGGAAKTNGSPATNTSSTPGITMPPPYQNPTFSCPGP
jgi:Flp pilus assembly pilin Flp